MANQLLWPRSRCGPVGARMSPVSTKPAYLDREGAAAFVSLSVITMERMVAKGEFPSPRQLTGKRVGWLVRELDEWSEARPVSSNLPPANCGGRRGVGVGEGVAA